MRSTARLAGLDATRMGRERLRIEGVAFDYAVVHKPMKGIDFVDCDMTGLVFEKARFSKAVLIEDCSFVECEWGVGSSALFSHSHLARCEFRGVSMRATHFKDSLIEDCTFERSRLDGLGLHRTVLKRVAMSRVELKSCHWEHSELESTTITGTARTLVLSDSVLRDVDLSGLRMVDSHVGGRIGAEVRFPAFTDSFVIPGRALEDVDAELAARLSPAALESYRTMRLVLMTDYVVIDPSLFRPAPDLVDMETTPADVDAILEALWARHVSASDGSSDEGARRSASA